MFQVLLLCSKCLNEDFRSRERLMGPLSGAVILKILYRFGDEDLVIWTSLRLVYGWIITQKTMAMNSYPCPNLN